MNTLLIVLAVLAVIGFVLWQQAQKKVAPAPSAAPSLPPYDTTKPVHDVRVKFPKEEAWGWMYNFAPGNQVFDMGETGSMVPYFNGSEFVVVAKNYGAIKLGDIVAYYAVTGRSPGLPPMIHRIVDGNAQTGWIPKGDAPGNPVETWNPITPDNYVGTLIAVFRPLNS